jgi:hypothetical protein
MSAWTIIRSTEYSVRRDELEQKFENDAEDALKRNNAREFRALQIAFYDFLDFLDSIETGEEDPENHLVYVVHDLEGLPIYSALSECENWRCLYVVDRSKKDADTKGTCTSIEIDRLTSNLKLIEIERHRVGKRSDSRLR